MSVDRGFKLAAKMMQIRGLIRKHINDFESFLKEKLNLEESAWLKQFRQECRIDAVQFADIWNKFDRDGEWSTFTFKAVKELLLLRKMRMTYAAACGSGRPGTP